MCVLHPSAWAQFLFLKIQVVRGCMYFAFLERQYFSARPLRVQRFAVSVDVVALSVLNSNSVADVCVSSA
jgi:hypothetical protein